MEKKPKKTYFFTFGYGQKKEGYVQPILASSWEAAREKMVELNGINWGFQYTELQWDKWKNKVAEERLPISIEKELPLIEGA